MIIVALPVNSSIQCRDFIDILAKIPTVAQSELDPHQVLANREVFLQDGILLVLGYLVKFLVQRTILFVLEILGCEDLHIVQLSLHDVHELKLPIVDGLLSQLPFVEDVLDQHEEQPRIAYHSLRHGRLIQELVHELASLIVSCVMDHLSPSDERIPDISASSEV